MPLKNINFSVKEKLKADFKGKCKNNKISMYQCLKDLIVKYLKEEIVPSTIPSKIQELERKLEEKEKFYKEWIEEKDKEINVLKAQRPTYLNQSEENTKTIKEIFRIMNEVNSHSDPHLLTPEQANFLFRFTFG